MSSCRRPSIFTLIALGTLGLGSALLPGGDGKDSAPEVGDFEEKLVIVTSYGQQEESSSVLLEKAKVKRLGERFFIVGVGIDEWTEGHWAQGVTAWVPVDNITSIVAVDTLEQARKVYEKGER